MHFTIPEVRDNKDSNGSIYQKFEVHLNGIHHCSVRYRQLHNLHQQLKRELQPTGRTWLPAFPPKKLITLTRPQLEERRTGLERYLQQIAQNAVLSGGLAFNGFMLAAQQETWADAEKATKVELDVYLMNDQKYTVVGRSVMQTETVLEKLGSQLGIPDEFTFYFGLYLIRRENGGSITIARKFQDHESPYISMKAYSGADLKLALRKSSWDPKIDDEILNNKSCLNILYVQTLSDVEHGWLQASQDVRKQLATMQARGAKSEYMELARTQTDFGCTRFAPCLCDYPVANSKVNALIGGRELIVRMVDETVDVQEGRFRVTRMRCWRVMSAEPVAVAALSSACGGAPIPDGCPSIESALELSFEYLMPRSKEMRWISIVSHQAILMSSCLQSVVEELLRIKNNQPVKKPNDGSSQLKQYCHRRRDGTEVSVPVRCSCRAAAVAPMRPANGLSKGNKSGSKRYSVKSLSERFDVVHMKEASRAAENVLIENEAFQDVRESEDD